MEEFTHMFDALLAVLELVDQPLRTPRNNTVYNQMLYTFAVDQDLDGNSLRDTTVNGSITAGLGTVLADGMQPPEVVVFSWTSITDLVITGSGNFSFNEQAHSSFRIVVGADTIIYGEDSNELEFSTFGLHLNLTLYMRSYGNLSYWDIANPWAGIYTGVIEFITRCNSDTLTGMMTVGTGDANFGSDIATVTLNKVNGVDVPYTFTINLETFAVTVGHQVYGLYQMMRRKRA